MRVKALLLAMFLAAGAFIAPASAAPRPEMWFVPVQERGGDQVQVSARDAINILRSRFGGQPLGPPPQLVQGARPFYVIQWRMPDGETIRTFQVDAVSGQVR